MLEHEVSIRQSKCDLTQHSLLTTIPECINTLTAIWRRQQQELPLNLMMHLCVITSNTHFKHHNLFKKCYQIVKLSQIVEYEPQNIQQVFAAPSC